MTSLTQADVNSKDPIKAATITALNRVLEPLLELMLDAGVTVQEFNKTVRERAVHVAMRRVIEETGRESKSRVAIVTGLSRSEVTKILQSMGSVAQAKPDHHPARRVLAAWFDDPHYGTPAGQPAVLPIFGKKRSFERLVEGYGSGNPVRAMLDELTQMGAIERLDDQKVRAKARVPILTGLTGTSIASLGERAQDLLETLHHNVRRRSEPLFEATALINDGDLDKVAFLRREIAEQGTNFINGATSLLNRSQRKRRAKTTGSDRRCRLGVTVYYFQDELPDGEQTKRSKEPIGRKNLRRRQEKPIGRPQGGQSSNLR